MSEFEPRGTLIDMHLHTIKGASDSMLEPNMLVSEAKKVGLTGINITEHDRMWDQWDIAPFKDQYPELFISTSTCFQPFSFRKSGTFLISSGSVISQEKQ